MTPAALSLDRTRNKIGEQESIERIIARATTRCDEATHDQAPSCEFASFISAGGIG
jgi:hypothetical protein